MEIGNKERIKFINECIARPERFEQRIKRQNLHTFATEGGKKKLTSKDGKLEETCLIRDLFGSILYVSLEKKVDMAEVLTYPLTPVPLSLSHVDGTMLKTDKSKLYSVLEPNKKSDPPVANETVIDASFFLYLQMNLPSTFGGVARAILSKVMNHNGSVIHYVTDKWLSPSIKDSERVGRNSSDQTDEIKGPNQKRPTKWMDALKNPNFKIALNKYLIDAWNDDSLAHIFQGKTLYANCGDVCYKYSPGENTVLRREESRLFSTHEEADSRMFHHIASSTLLHQSNSDAESNMVVRTNDVDCLVIAIGCFENLLALNKSINFWLEVGVESKNNLRYINVNEIYENLGPLLASALLAFHAFFGCDYLAAFSRKGKVRPYNLLKTDGPAQEAFASLSEGLPEVNEEVIDEIKRFLCKVYGKKKVTSINEVRLQVFASKYKQKKNGTKSITDVKSMDGSAMPPCYRVLLEKIKRTAFVASRWYSSTMPIEPAASPADHGWVFGDDGKYRIKWFDGETAPRSLDIILNDVVDEEEDNSDENDDSEETDEEMEEADGWDSEDSDESDSDEDYNCGHYKWNVLRFLPNYKKPQGMWRCFIPL